MEAAQAATFRFVDLFSGVGGFHHALAAPNFGGECVLAVEIDEPCRTVYRTAFPQTPLLEDIRFITRSKDGNDRSPDEIRNIVPDHEVLCAGFPCQPFSKSGQQDGIRDRTRGTLFFDILQIARARQPEFLILENVRNLAGPRHRDTWRTIVASLSEEGYTVAEDPVVFSPHLLPPRLGGRPQLRDRVFILGYRTDRSASSIGPGSMPLVSYQPVADWNPRDWRIEEWLDDDDDIPDLGAYSLRPEELGWIDAWDWLVRQIPSNHLPGFPMWADAFVARPSIPSSTPDWKANFLRKNAAFYREHAEVIREWRSRRFGPLSQSVADFPPSRRKFEWQAREAQPSRPGRSLWDLVIHLRPSGIRVRPPTYLPALVAITQTSIIGRRRRRITPREAARLQGIDYEPFAVAEVDDTAIYRQMGNAVNVGAVQWVARALFAAGRKEWGRSRVWLDATSQSTQQESLLASLSA